MKRNMWLGRCSKIALHNWYRGLFTIFVLCLTVPRRLQENEKPESVAKVTIPYVQHLSESIKRFLNISVSFVHIRELLVKVKDAVNKEFHARVVTVHTCMWVMPRVMYSWSC